MADEKKGEFVVSDRRRFAPEGELKPEAREETPPVAPPEAPEEAKPAAEPEPQMPPPPTAEEAKAQKDAYDESNRQLDEQLKSRLAGHDLRQFEMTFERFVASLYMTALLQLGMAAPEGEQPRVDIMGARQTIDTLAILQEKTKGNLTDSEKNMLQQALYELRMAWLEVMNAISRPPDPNAPQPGGPGMPPGGGPTRVK